MVVPQPLTIKLYMAALNLSLNLKNKGSIQANEKNNSFKIDSLFKKLLGKRNQEKTMKKCVSWMIPVSDVLR